MRKKILIIEDEYQLLHSLYIDLQEEYTVIKASDGVAGLKIAYLHHPDMILLDVLLPRMSGEDFLKKLRISKWGKDVKVIVMSNIDDNKIKELMQKAKINDYIVKCNNSLKDLSNRIRLNFM